MTQIWGPLAAEPFDIKKKLFVTPFLLSLFVQKRWSRSQIPNRTRGNGPPVLPPSKIRLSVEPEVVTGSRIS